MQSNKLIEVCDSCNRACCWYGEFMCDESYESGTVKKTIAELSEKNLEHRSYWSDKKMTEVYGDPAPHGYAA